MLQTKLSRRTVIAGLAASAVAPNLLFARQEKVILGEGKHKYEWIKGWAKLPEGKTFAPTHGCVMVDSKDNVYINTDNKDAVMVFDKDGNFLKAWGKDISGGSAHGMQIVKEGDKEVLYMAHTGRHKIYKATLDGEVTMTVGWPEKSGVYKTEREYVPTMVAVAPNGDLFVGDGYGKSWVHRFTKDGEYVTGWNGSKTKSGPMRTPHGVWIDTRGEKPLVMVADRGNGRILTFTPDGELVDIVIEKLPSPCKVFIHSDGDILIPNLGGSVTILDKANKLVAHLGANKHGLGGKFEAPVDKWVDGEFTAPHGACWDSQGNMYVEDWNKFGRVNKLARVKA